VDEEINNN